jgi:hypothetical protein
VPDGLVSGDELLDALRSLGAKLHRKGVTADVYVFGGAAMVIAYKARPATRDIDAVFAPDTEVVDAPVRVATAASDEPERRLRASSVLTPAAPYGRPIYGGPGTSSIVGTTWATAAPTAAV